MDMGIEYLIRDTLLSSLELSRRVLQGIGDSPVEAAESVEVFEAFDSALLQRQQAVQHDEGQFIQTTKEAAEELRELFERQAAETLGSKGEGRR